ERCPRSRPLNRVSRIILVVLIAVIILFLLARIRYSGTAPGNLQDESCNRDLWNYVYEKDRLRIIQECVAVEGSVVSLHRNSDGDVHIGLDPENKSVLNLVNVMHAHRKLVVEIICDHPPSESDALAACGDFHSQTTIPKVGDRVRVTGAYVTDRDNGWNEVHPVTRI